jgi:hypothetical protein
MANGEDLKKVVGEKILKAQEAAAKAAEVAAKIEAAQAKAAAIAATAIKAKETVAKIKAARQLAKSQGLKPGLPPGLGGLIVSVLKQVIVSLNLQEKAINKIISELEESCPNAEKLQELIEKKNKVQSVLTEVTQAISSVNQTGATISTILGVLDTVITVLKLLPFPVAIPPGIGVPANIITLIGDGIRVADKELDKLKGIVDGIVGGIGVIKSTVESLLEYVSLLDQAIEFCASKIAAEEANTPEEAQSIISEFLTRVDSFNSPTPDVSTIPPVIGTAIIKSIDINGGVNSLEILNKGSNYNPLKLVSLTRGNNSTALIKINTNNQGSITGFTINTSGNNYGNGDIVSLNPINSSPPIEAAFPVIYKGFEINVENNPIETLSTIPRRRPIAFNPTSNVKITGDYSFSSNVQILVDTMKFAIDNYLNNFNPLSNNPQ